MWMRMLRMWMQGLENSNNDADIAGATGEEGRIAEDADEEEVEAY